MYTLRQIITDPLPTNIGCSELQRIADQASTACMDVAECLVIEVVPSVDDPGCICVRVFGAAEDEIPRLEEAILALGESLFGDDGPVLLPMIKTISVTEEYYPCQYSELRAREPANYAKPPSPTSPSPTAPTGNKPSPPGNPNTNP
jgi:hypothetical protein